MCLVFILYKGFYDFLFFFVNGVNRALGWRENSVLVEVCFCMFLYVWLLIYFIYKGFDTFFVINNLEDNYVFGGDWFSKLWDLALWEDCVRNLFIFFYVKGSES